MSRTDVEGELPSQAPPSSSGIEIVAPREVPLGGIRSITVRRTLPNRYRTTIGPWCFLDHYGPDLVDDSGGMVVPPHPHTGLQTVSWLFQGAIHHRDSTGADALVVPGELNIMTAGRGVQHSEVSTPETGALHGVQLWVALPDEHRSQLPHFSAHPSVVASIEGVEVRLITGYLEQVGHVDAPHYWPMVAAQVEVPAGGSLDLKVNLDFEHGVLVDQGDLVVNNADLPRHHLGYLPMGSSQITISAGSHATRAILIGGKPFEEPLAMWWNFVGRNQEDIEQARHEWQQGLVEGSPRFGHLDHMAPLPAPEMPAVTLKSRPPGPRPPS